MTHKAHSNDPVTEQSPIIVLKGIRRKSGCGPALFACDKPTFEAER